MSRREVCTSTVATPVALALAGVVGSAAIAATPMEALYAEWKRAQDHMESFDDDGVPIFNDPQRANDWREAVDAAKALRAKIIVEPPRNAKDFWLKVNVALRTSGGHVGLDEEIMDDLKDGEAYCSTLAFAVLRDLLRMKPQI